ncbi:hypothetical protein C8F04DRAFT_1134056 [Mycena alexandri]|uniref:Uncharacterized protein n=1 Tax=Mycena alexandri TaxID=1745969 RepID=A0AAD6WWC8_9AGAR|nr:hypothetical protein C8F04DRAFT_1134056 [Mycena alexandri]
MDPLSILSTVLSSAIAIYRWVGDLKSKENAILDLKSSLSSLTVVLHPLREKAASGKLDSQVGILACVQDLSECLSTAREHLQTWQESEARKGGPINFKRILAFLDPSQVIEMVKEDAVRINRTITMLTLAIQLAWTPGLRSTTSSLDFIVNADAKAFWRQMIGADTLCCPMNIFSSALSTWLGGNVTVPDNLLLQLDEQGFGGVTPSSFSRFVGSQSIAQAISQYIKPIKVLTAPSVDGVIIWVAEDPQNYRANVEYAESLGIKVICFSSLAAVKSWMELNHRFILPVANSHRLRFISDSARNEGGIFNPAAGESLLRYLRGRLLPSPCLIFAPSVETTAYVSAYERAGSTTDIQILRGYIKALAQRIRDVEWVGFNARSGIVQMFALAPSPQDQWFHQPLLIYIAGTRPEQDQVHIEYASALGITVVSLFSTDELKQYVHANQDQLGRVAAAHRLRFITQNVRLNGEVLDVQAGEDTVKYVRKQGLAAPVLVLSTSSIATTGFVALYERVGSTTDARVVRGYIEALAAGVRDTEWVGFDRKL